MRDLPASPASLDGLLFRALMDKAVDSIFFKDGDGKYLRVSNRMVGAFDLDHPSQVEGKTDADFYAADHVAEIKKMEQQIMQSGIPVLDTEETKTLADGSMSWASTSRFPLYDGEGKILGILGISRDITDAKIAQEQLETAQKKAIEEEKKSAVSDFAAMIVANMGSSTVEITQSVDRALTILASAKTDPAAASKAQEELREIRHMAKRLADLMKITGI